jgi:hypothetical protein
MTGPDTDRGEMRSRKDRDWRDATNPHGPSPGVEPGEPRPAGERPPKTPDTGERVDTDSTSGPGGGGATDWSGRVKEYEGLHGGASRKP